MLSVVPKVRTNLHLLFYRQTLARLRGIPTSSLERDLSDSKDLGSEPAKRTLFGRVLIAEGGVSLQLARSFFDSNCSSKDNDVARKLLRKQLERLDLTVTETENGDEAVKGVF